MNDAVFQQKLVSVMSDNKYDRVIPKRNAGKLDSRSLWRVEVGAKNVFRQKQERKGKEYSVVLCVDESGSMVKFGGGKYQTKLAAAIELACFMSKHLATSGVSFSVIGFNCNVVTHKRFEQEKLDMGKLEKDMKENFKGYYHHTGWEFAHGNHDYDALELGYRMLGGRHHGKILICLSDGQPACDAPHSCGYDQSKHDHDRIRKLVVSNPQVLSCGVGVLQSAHLYKMFPEVIEVNDLDSFKGQMIGFLSKHIKRG